MFVAVVKIFYDICSAQKEVAFALVFSLQMYNVLAEIFYFFLKKYNILEIS